MATHLTVLYAGSHFTILRFMTAMGQTVCCIVIMACLEVEAKHILGHQPWAEINGEVTTNLNENTNGTEKYYPHGPTCFYSGKEIPCYITCSENGSITSVILAQILQYLLEYINDAQHEWAVCIGAPFGTSYWQVRDSSQQNGAFKIDLKKAKQFVTLL